MNTFVDQTTIPDAPGSEDMSPVAMQCGSLPDVVEPSEGSIVKPLEMNDDEVNDLFDKELPPDSHLKEKDLEEILTATTEEEAIKKAEFYLTKWLDFTPEEFDMIRADAIGNNCSYSEELLKTAAEEGGVYRNKQITPEEQVEVENWENKAYAFCQCTLCRKAQQQAGQPMQQGQTQPPKGVSNMEGGSTGSQGSTPGTQKPTEGGTTGTTPIATPTKPGVGKPNPNPTNSINQSMNQNANQPAQAVVNQESMDDLLVDEDVLPPDDEMLLRVFDTV